MSEWQCDVCAFCGEFVEEVKEVNIGGSQPDLICISCYDEQWGYLKARSM